MKGLRRASVNAFGFGGSNSHVVLDDAYNYLLLHGLEGKHNSVAEPPEVETVTDALASGPNSKLVYLNGDGQDHAPNSVVPNGSCLSPSGTDIHTQTDPAIETSRPKLLVWSAADEDGLRRVSDLYTVYLSKLSRSLLSTSQQSKYLDNLAFTLAYRRTSFPWKAFTVANSLLELFQKGISFSRPRRSSEKLGIAYLFTGQGAQYAEMGRELLAYSTFKATLSAAEVILCGLGCEWSLLGKLQSFPYGALPLSGYRF